MLESVQTEASVIVSAGHDGRIMLWNVKNGTLIKSFYNNVSTTCYEKFIFYLYSLTLQEFKII